MRAPTESGLPWDEYIRPDWLALRREEALDPELPIIDPHHHIWEHLGYGAQAFLKDLQGGHNVLKTVHLESGLGRNPADPEHLRPIGETRYLIDTIDDPLLRAPGAPDICAGIVGDAELALPGHELAELLDGHIAAGKGRFKGTRFNAFWDDGVMWRDDMRPDMLQEPAIRRGLAMLAERGLVCDVMVFHRQLGELADLAEAMPELTFIVNHFGGFLGRKAKHGDYAAEYRNWRQGIEALSRHDNVRMKIGGLATDFFSGIQLHLEPLPPSSEKIAEIYRPFFEPCVELFGSARCMFESNYPAERQQVDYVILWNGFKRLASGASAKERTDLFHDTALHAYTL